MKEFNEFLEKIETIRDKVYDEIKHKLFGDIRKVIDYVIEGNKDTFREIITDIIENELRSSFNRGYMEGYNSAMNIAINRLRLNIPEELRKIDLSEIMKDMKTGNIVSNKDKRYYLNSENDKNDDGDEE